MTKKARMLHGEWPRWSKYQFAEGRISPAPGARLERYDPWGEYEAGKERGEPPPYVELLNILRDFRPHARQEYSSGEMGRILEWTRRHGLLGVLHKHLFALTDDIDSSFYHQFILVGPRLVECNRRYDRGVRIRSYEGWAVNYLPQDLGSTPRGTYAIESDHSENICYITDRFLLPLPDDLYKDAMQRLPPSASAVVDPAPHDDQPLDDQPLDDQQPDLVDTMSDEFFAGYCEPIEHWFGDVFAFAEGVYEKGQGEFPIDLSRISLQFTRANGTPELRHTYASLLDALALMFAQDQITGYRVVQCAGCGCDVVTTAYQALYCSRRCGDRDRKRKSRAAAAAKLAKMA